MKQKIAFLSLSVILSFVGCSDSSPEVPKNEGKGSDNVYVNKWIYSQMKDNYYWTDKIPDISALDTKQDADAFFKSTLYQYLIIDRFSYIERNQTRMTKSTTPNEIGFEYTGVHFVDRDGKDTGEYGLTINYIKPNTDAAKQGLKRGQIIRKVDNVKISKGNWYSVLSNNKESYKLEILNIENGKSNIIEKNIVVSHNYRESPVYMDSIYIDGVRKIGYLVFNSFGTSVDADTDEDNLKLINKLAEFENANITDLILDLRYNGGGLVRTAVYLASALVPNRKKEHIFEIKEFNKRNQELFGNSSTDYFLDNMDNAGKTAIPRLGDKINLYILTGQNTASASELTINGLNPWAKDNGKKITLIGERTYGKNVGSFPIVNETDEQLKQWILHPISFRSYNRDKESNYSQGFEPDINVSDFGSLEKGLKPLGDINENLLSAALARITGRPTTRMQAESKFVIEGTSLERKVLPLIIESLK